MHMHTSVILN